MFSYSLVLFLLSAFMTFLCLYFMIPYLRDQLLDRPNSRSSHIRPTPRGGGLAFVIVTCFLFLILLLLDGFSSFLILPIFCLPIALIGFLDDYFSLPAAWRYFVHLFTALIIVLGAPLMRDSVGYTHVSASSLIIVLVILFALTAVINFVNFMDGIDGLVAGCMFVSLSSAAFYLSLLPSVWVFIGSIFGFLIWNWHPARVFMGDVGSTFLGAMFGGIALQANTFPGALTVLLLATPLLGDAFFCVLRRFFAGQRVFAAHRLHLFQRLHQSGWPHYRVSILYIGATLLLTVVLFSGGLPWVITCVALELLIGLWLDQHIAVPFVVASRN